MGRHENGGGRLEEGIKAIVKGGRKDKFKRRQKHRKGKS